MKNQIKITAFALLSLLFSQNSHAVANITCMPAVLDFVMRDFNQTLQTTGLIVPNPDGKLSINLGKDIEYDSVNITDEHKNSYRIDVPLIFIDGHSTNLVIWTNVMIEDYNNCKIFPEKPTYHAYKRRN